jgi:hypothetical protein
VSQSGYETAKKIRKEAFYDRNEQEREVKVSYFVFSTKTSTPVYMVLNNMASALEKETIFKLQFNYV